MQAVTFGRIASGASGTINFPATSLGDGPATVTLTSQPPKGVPVPDAVHRNGKLPDRSRDDIGYAVTPLAYVVVDSSTPLTYRATPAFTLSFANAGISGYAYLAFFDPMNPQLGWNLVTGAAPTNGLSVTIPSANDNSPPLALSAGTGYIFAIVANGTMLPTPVPALGTITEYVIPGAYNGNLGLTDGITTGPDGNLWFTELSDDNIDKMTPAGVVTKYPQIASESEAPQGIVTGPDGNLWIANNNGTIGKMTTRGSYTEYHVPYKGSSAVNIAVGPDGNLWFTDFGTGAIGKITTSGIVTEYPVPVPSGSYHPYGPGLALFGIAAGPDGNLWFTEAYADGVGKITPKGVITTYSLINVPGTQGNAEPIGITAGPDGNMWFVDTEDSALDKITPNGAVTQYLIGISGNLQSIVIGPDGNFWATDAYNGRITRIKPNGVFNGYDTPTQSSEPIGITRGPDGNLWFTETGVSQIGKIVP
jgi:streptogramin lyase